jgi:chromosomal replication initiation ATPase DnaA
MAYKLGSSRLLVKIATGLEIFGEKGFEQRLDNLLVKKNKKEDSIGTKSNSIVLIVSDIYSLPIENILRGRVGKEKFAMSICVYFMKNKIQLPHLEIALYFNRSSHSFVNRVVDYIHEIYHSKLPEDAKMVQEIKDIEKLIDSALSK